MKKEKSEEVGKGAMTIINAYHQKYREELQSFSVNTSNGLVTTASGTKVRFPANGFITDDGTTASGNVSIRIKEIYTPADMIMANMPTTSNGRLLESGGEFQIVASQNNKSLKLAPGTFIQIDFPTAGRDMNGMQVFNGVPDADENIDWVLNSNPGNFVVPDSLLFSGAKLFADNINWINCDKFINDPTVEYTVYPGNAPSGDSTNVFVHLTGRNSVVKMNWTRGLDYFNSNTLLPVPSSIIGISVKNGKLHASITPVTIVNGMSTTLNFIPYTEAELKVELQKLK